MYVATSQQLKRYDQALLDEGYTIEELVDKASDQLLKHFDSYHKILIISGPGNNGADGISLALKLDRQGKEVALYIIGEFAKLSQANRYYLTLAKQSHIKAVFLDQNGLEILEKEAQNYEVIVDAMFGFGLNSDLRGIVKSTVDMINTIYETDIIAVDIPTGLNPDTGIPYNACVCATKTITLTALKQAFLNEESQMYTGEVVLETLDAKDLREDLSLAKLVSHHFVKYHLKPRLFNGHKGNYGRVLHITGCDHYRGAALLASRASVYSGSGIVTVCSTEKVIDALSYMTPECTSLLRQKYIDDDTLKGKNAVLLGSGLGLTRETYDLVVHLLGHIQLPIVVDGDALTILAQNQDLLLAHQGPVILTPHVGEFKRFVSFENEVEMVDVAREFAQHYRVILVLKGPNTMITDGNEVYRNSTANKAMATAGMGDVLAGMIVSFLGQGYSPKTAAIIGVYLHGLCGDELAESAYTAIPSRLIELIPKKMYDILK